MTSTEFTRNIRESIRAAKEEEAIAATKAAQSQGDMVAAAHHEVRARAFHDSWRNPDAQHEVDQEAIAQLKDSLSHPDPDVRQSARDGLQNLGVLVR
jgi:hypothetical protein